MSKNHQPTKKLNLLRSGAFVSKLFLLLTKDAIDPIIICVQILKMNSQNRNNEEIETIIPLLSNYSNLIRLLMFNESVNRYHDILKQFAQISFFKYSQMNSIIRRPNEKQNWFFLVLNGRVAVLAIKFKKCGLTRDEYITYLIKLRLLEEQNMFYQCVQLNKKNIDIDENYLNSMPKVKYEVYVSRALADIISYNRSYTQNPLIIPSLDQYMKITYPSKSNGLIDKEAKVTCSLPKYKHVNTLNSGDFFGSLMPFESNLTMSGGKDYHSYVALTDCDLTYVNVEEHNSSPLFTTMKNKIKRKCHQDIITKYYMFQNIERVRFEESYAKLFSFRVSKKGEKIILQDSFSEGVFLLINGTFEITTKRSFDELDGLISQLKQSLDGLNEIYSDLPHIENNQKKKLETEMNRMCQIKNFSKRLQERRIIRLNQVSSKEAFGLNECYDHMTKMNHFTFECISDKGELLYIQRDAFMYMYHKEPSLKEFLSRIIENKVEFYLETIKRYKDTFNKCSVSPISKIPNKRHIPFNDYYSLSENTQSSSFMKERDKRQMGVTRNINQNIPKRHITEMMLTQSALKIDNCLSKKDHSSLSKKDNTSISKKENSIKRYPKLSIISPKRVILSFKNSSNLLSTQKDFHNRTAFSPPNTTIKKTKNIFLNQIRNSILKINNI